RGGQDRADPAILARMRDRLAPQLVGEPPRWRGGPRAQPGVQPALVVAGLTEHDQDLGDAARGIEIERSALSLVILDLAASPLVLGAVQRGERAVQLDPPRVDLEQAVELGDRLAA